MALDRRGSGVHALAGRGSTGVGDYREGLICFQQAERLGHKGAASMISVCRKQLYNNPSH